MVFIFLKHASHTASFFFRFYEIILGGTVSLVFNFLIQKERERERERVEIFENSS